jgi:hypothetical protein
MSRGREGAVFHKCETVFMKRRTLAAEPMQIQANRQAAPDW